MSAHQSVDRGALIALILGAACIGFAPIFAFESEVGPSATGFWRIALAVPVFWLLMRREAAKDLSPMPITRREKTKLIFGGVLFAIDIAIWHWSLQFTTVANATLIANMTPIVVALGAVLLFGERLSRRFYGGLALSMMGIMLLSYRSLQVGGGRLEGDGMALMAAFFYGSYLLALGRLRLRFSTSTVMAWTGVASAIVLVPMAYFSGEQFFPKTAEGWWLIIGLAVVAQLLGQWLIAYAMAHLPAAFGALTLLVQPVVAAIVAWYVLGQTLGALEFMGAAVILSGIVLARLGTTRRAVGTPKA